MVTTDLRKLQILNDLIAQTLDVLERRVAQWGGFPQAQSTADAFFGMGAPNGAQIPFVPQGGIGPFGGYAMGVLGQGGPHYGYAMPVPQPYAHGTWAGAPVQNALTPQQAAYLFGQMGPGTIGTGPGAFYGRPVGVGVIHAHGPQGGALGPMGYGPTMGW
jgi:hypothetical protein